MRKEEGFSIIELLIVVTIIGVIAAVAIPNLRKARQAANAASAVQSLRTISTAQFLYERKYRTYGTLVDLAPEGTIDPNLAVGNKSYYLFAITVTDSSHYSGTATPIEEPTVFTHFFINETAVIRFNEGAPADATSSPIPR